MCGIAGIFHYGEGSGPVDLRELLDMREAMRLRGPDGCGVWTSADGRVGLAQRRLAIVDLSDAGRQPMLDESGELAVVFNGEIYNYPELREELEGRGAKFRSRCDTEVLLHLYRECGLAMFERLRGMFALALWDGTTRSLVVARDGFGIKPLYLSDDGRTLRLASQVRALLAGGCVQAAPSAAGHVGFLLWGSVPEPYTLYDHVRALPAGSYAVFRAGGVARQGSFCSIRDVIQEGEAEAAERGGAEDPAELSELLRDSVRHHLMADVPVGVFLSAGRDSSTLAALASECHGAVRTFTLGFEEYRDTERDETVLAAEVARQYGCRHVTAWVPSREFVVAEILSAMDQPSIDGVNTYLVSKGAAAAGLKVALSGLGGDEVFGGYPSFHRLPRMRRWTRWVPRVRGSGRMLGSVMPEKWRKHAGLVEYGQSVERAYLLLRCLNVPWRMKDLVSPGFLMEGMGELGTERQLAESVSGIRSTHLTVTALELQWYMRNQLLRDTDWASMAHSLEVRVPFLDLPLLRAAARRVRHWSKRDMAGTPGVALPEGIVRRPKTGFSVPVARWAHERSGLRRSEKLQPWAEYLYHAFTAGEAGGDGAVR